MSNQMGLRETRSANFADTASRGSQTDPPLNEAVTGGNPTSAPLEHKALNPNEMGKKRWGDKQPIRSLLINSDSDLTTPPRIYKKRRTIPMSNWECGPEPPYSVPTEFDLNGFAFTALPDPHQRYELFNNDLVLEHYAPAVRTYSGAQRKGIVEPFPNASSYIEHITEALQAPFPLAEHTPLPRDLLTALKFHRDNSRETIMEFQRSQLKQLRIIAQECIPDTERWYRFTPEGLKSTVGSINVALLAHLTRFTRMKGTNWLMQFVVGFPITGILIQVNVFPATEPKEGAILDPESLYSSKTTRFRARSNRANSRSAQELWDEALVQVTKGWLDPPPTA